MTHLFLHRWFEPQRPLAALFALAFAPDKLRTALAQEGFFVHCCVRESPLYSLRGSEGVHRPTVEAASVSLELGFAAGAVFVLRSKGTSSNASPPTGSKRACGACRLLGVFFDLRRPTRAVHLCTDGRLREFDGEGGLPWYYLLWLCRCNEAFLCRGSSINRLCVGGRGHFCRNKVGGCGVGIVVLVRI